MTMYQVGDVVRDLVGHEYRVLEVFAGGWQYLVESITGRFIVRVGRSDLK